MNDVLNPRPTTPLPSVSTLLSPNLVSSGAGIGYIVKEEPESKVLAQILVTVTTSFHQVTLGFSGKPNPINHHLGQG